MPPSSPPAGVFAGYASVFNVKDNQGDIIIPGAFRASLLRWQAEADMPRLLWQHDLKQPIGRILTLKEDHHGLLVTARLTSGVQQSREALALLEDKALHSLSIGFRIRQSHYDATLKARRITDVDLWEISLVTIAANRHARVQRLTTQPS